MNEFKQDKIAIIVPIYNAEHKLRKCIKSILKQMVKNIELVDDCLTDRSGTIYDYYATNDKRVHVIHKVTEGSVAARKDGVFSEYAQNSQYIIFVDAVDVLPKTALENLILQLKSIRLI